jgi:gliding motility-associated protein GldM
MSGGNCPETPRQKMIGMMYLFLTAMLALNVSGELLKAFELVDKSIQKTVETMEQKNSLLYDQFRNANEFNPKKVGKRYNKALTIREEADDLVNHVDSIKYLIVQTADGPEVTPDNYTSKDNQDVAAQVMITAKGGARSQELKDRMTDFRDLLMSMVDDRDTTLLNAIENTLTPKDPPSEGGASRSWESEKFESLPMSAVMALMSQIQSEVRNVESDVVRYLFGKIDEGSVSFTSLDAIVVPTSQYVFQGEKYTAKIMLAARDTTRNPEVFVKGEKLSTVKDGVGFYEVTTNTLGKHEWDGLIRLEKSDGTYIEKSVEGTYFVSKPGVVVSPTKMNVFYVGVDNPVEVSAPGVPSDNLIVRIRQNAVIQKQTGSQYVVRPHKNSAGKNATVYVSSKTKDGEELQLGSQPFRIKRVPDPIATVAGMRGGGIGKNLLMAQKAVIAKMDNFDFDLRFNVTNFRISTVKDGYVQFLDSEGSAITNEQKELINSVGVGGVVLFNNIQAKGPDGSTRDLGSLSFSIQ